MKKYNSFFIRKNTKELIDKLKKYGFRHNTLKLINEINKDKEE